MATVGGIVVCRMDSQRLPGKTLREVRGRPLLWYVLARCRAFSAAADRVIVATTSRPVDDPIAAFCADHGYQCYRGATKDVAGRLLAAAKESESDWFFRLNGDSPFVDPALLAEAWRIASIGEYDFVTNLAPRSYPYGISVELLRTDVYARAYGQITTPGHLEHATQFLYARLPYFRYYNMLLKGEDLSGVRLTVDAEADFAFFAHAVGALESRWSSFSFRQAVGLYRAQKPDLSPAT